MLRRRWTTCLQIHGGAGYMREYEIERTARDARLGPIGGGTDEIMREILGQGAGAIAVPVTATRSTPSVSRPSASTTSGWVNGAVASRRRAARCLAQAPIPSCAVAAARGRSSRSSVATRSRRPDSDRASPASRLSRRMLFPGTATGLWSSGGPRASARRRRSSPAMRAPASLDAARASRGGRFAAGRRRARRSPTARRHRTRSTFPS